MGDYTSWKVGDRVVCVYADPLPTTIWCVGEELVSGRIYTVSRILVDGDGDVIVHLCEVSRTSASRMVWGDDAGYLASRFRRVQPRKTSIEIFHRILSKPHIKIREDA